MLLGDLVQKALSTVGVTEERVQAFLGQPCSCKKRRDRLNQLDTWARRVVAGKVDNATKYLNDLIGEPQKK